MTKQRRRPSGRHISSQTLAALIIIPALILVSAVVGGWIWCQDNCNPRSTSISVVVQEDQRTPGLPVEFVDTVLAAALEASEHGSGTLTLHQVAGGDPLLVGTIDLRVRRDDGSIEHDPRQREKLLGDAIQQLFEQAKSSPATGDGRSLTAVAKAIAATRPGAGSEWIVYYYGLGTWTVDPVDFRLLFATDPSLAVESLPENARIDVVGASVRAYLASPVNGQPVFNSATSAWRDAFITGYFQAGAAADVQILEPGVSGDPDPMSPDAPVIENLPALTEVLLPPPGPDPVATLDSAMFYPDEDRLLDEKAAVQLLKPLAEAWATGAYSRVECIGRIAAFVPPDSAFGLELSQRRADKIVALLWDEYAVPATGIGVGSSQPLPGDPQGSHQRSTICTAFE
jgi:hypothetical protein